MKRVRTPRPYGVGMTPTGNPFRKSRHAIKLTPSERQSQICQRCELTRYEHERRGIVPDHEFVEQHMEGK